MALRRSSDLTRTRAPTAGDSGKPFLYTAQDVARFCEVDLKTVHHWADKGKVVCFRTAGRHLRFRRNDVVRFLRAHGYPLPDALVRARPTVAFALAGADDLAKKLAARLTLRRYPTALAAVAHLCADQPDALVFAIDDPSLGGARSLTALKSSPETSWIVVCALTADDALAAAARDAGADVAFASRDVAKVAPELARMLAIDSKGESAGVLNARRPIA